MKTMYAHTYKSIQKTFTAALGLAALAGFGATAHAADYYIPAAAPITYKMANPNMMGLMPQTNAPQTNVPMRAEVFNPSSVDPVLYAHQKVGNPYTIMGQTYYPAHNPGYDMVGTASWYGDKYHGKLTANGETYDKNAMTAAHKTLPLNSYVVVTNMATGVALKLRINDRGPFVGGRIIDLSEAAADALGFKATGLGDVRVQYAGPAGAQSASAAPMLAPAPAPVQLAPVQPTPQAQYQAPQPQLQYRPLRQMPGQMQGQVQAQPAPAPAAQPVPMPAAPQVQQYAQLPQAPMNLGPQTRLPAAPTPIPQGYAPQRDSAQGGVVTLTIKGPIHMANSQSDDTQARVIPAMYRTTK